MSILTQKLPDFVLVCGKKYPIRTDFRVWLSFDEAAFGGGPLGEQVVLLLTNLFLPGPLPPTLEQALEALCAFYSRNMPNTQKNGAKSAKRQKRVTSFTQDAPFIYAAFWAQYGIDLQKADLHWWQFLALLDGLVGQKYCDIVSWRAMDLSKISDKRQRAHYRKLQAAFRLRGEQDQEASQQEFLDGLEKIL